MKFVCSELQGASHQPKIPLEIDNCWVVPSFSDGPVLTESDCRLVFVHDEATDEDKAASVEYYFVHCFQFLFCRYSRVYRHYSLRHMNPPQPFVLEGEDIGVIERQIRKRFVQHDFGLPIGYEGVAVNQSRDFANIPSPYGTLLPSSVNFVKLYAEFRKLCENDVEFREIVTLFCETVDGPRSLYNNILQHIAQLQTICDTMLGEPKKSRCSHCKQDTNVESWDAFLGKRLRELGIKDPEEILLVAKVRKTLNRPARVQYIHYSRYLNPWDLRNMDKNIRTGESAYEFDLDDVFKTETSSWRPLDWANLYDLYVVLVRNLIFAKYFPLLTT
jgi:hypothetical protein